MRLIEESVIVMSLAAGLLTVLAAASRAAEAPGPAFTSRTVKEYAPVAGAAPAASVSLPALPSGPKEFAVDRPRPQKEMVVSVRDFGADPKRDDNSEAFAQAIQHCQERKASTLVIPKGVYRFQVGQPALELSGLTDFTLDGQGSELIRRNTNRRGHRGMFQIAGCERIEVKDVVLDWDCDLDPLASLVKVSGVAPAGESSDVEFLRHTRFPNRSARMKVLEAVDPATMTVGCEGKSDIYLPDWRDDKAAGATEWLSDNVARLRNSNFKNVLVGDLFRVRHYAYGPAAVMLRRSRHVTLSGLRIYGCPGMAIVGRDRPQYVHLRDCVIDRRPGAGRMISCTADHINFGDTLGHLLIENCNAGWGGDDCVNVHTGCSPAERLDNKTVAARLMDHRFQRGDLLEFRGLDLAPLGFQTRIASIGAGPSGRTAVTLEDSLPDSIPREFVLYNRAYQSGNVIIRGCYFHENRARGVLVEASDYLIEKCRFYRVQMNALLLNSGFSYNAWSEGQEVRNVVVRDNTFEDCNKAGIGERGPQVFMTVYLGRTDTPDRKTAYPIFQDVLFERNRFLDCPGSSFFISSARNVVVRDNALRFRDSKGRGHANDRSKVFVSYASGVHVVNNRWFKSPHVPAPGALVDLSNADEIHWEGNALVTDGDAVPARAIPSP
jgi:hypothetical protein